MMSLFMKAKNTKRDTKNSATTLPLVNGIAKKKKHTGGESIGGGLKRSKTGTNHRESQENHQRNIET